MNKKILKKTLNYVIQCKGGVSRQQIINEVSKQCECEETDCVQGAIVLLEDHKHIKLYKSYDESMLADLFVPTQKGIEFFATWYKKCFYFIRDVVFAVLKININIE